FRSRNARMFEGVHAPGSNSLENLELLGLKLVVAQDACVAKFGKLFQLGDRVRSCSIPWGCRCGGRHRRRGNTVGGLVAHGVLPTLRFVAGLAGSLFYVPLGPPGL